MEVLETQQEVLDVLSAEIAALANSGDQPSRPCTGAHPMISMLIVTKLLDLRDELARIYNEQRPGSIGISFSADFFDGVRYVTIQATVNEPA